MPCRVLLFTGKGGVGKTTVAAATALRCADSGLRTLVLSTDPAHSLADAFDQPLDGQPRQVVEGLLGPAARRAPSGSRTRGATSRPTSSSCSAGPASTASRPRSCPSCPGLDELFALSDIKDHADSGQWDVVVVDCAPTAETIRLLSLPEVLSWYMDRVFPVERSLVRAVRPLLSRITTHAGGGRRRVRRHPAALRPARRRARSCSPIPVRSSVRLVVNPEKMVIAEARRTATYLSLFGYRVDAVVANRLLPDDVTDPWFKAWKRDPSRARERHRGRVRAPAGAPGRPGRRRAGGDSNGCGRSPRRCTAISTRPASCTRASRCGSSGGTTIWSSASACRSPIETT